MKKFSTRAKTAYGLLSEIRRLILEEPKRYNQRDLLVVFDKTLTKNKSVSGIFYNYSTDAGNVPSCGTIGCVAGWVTALRSNRPARVVSPWEYARRVLGLTGVQSEELFSASAITNYVAPQTPEHAQAGAKHIEAFQNKYRAQLSRTEL